MCGLVAALHASSSLSRDRLERSLDVPYHRGPDERGSWTSPGGSITLGHTRLSIIGLENGQQPMHEESRRTRYGREWRVLRLPRHPRRPSCPSPQVRY